MNQEKPREWSNFFFLKIFKNALFGHILKTNHHIHFFGAWLFLMVHIQITPSEGPKTL